MLGNVGVYTVKRRKKPVQKNTLQAPTKTNPSKRHRDRLNMELERLTCLLPFSEEVRSRLDKLSVLRLSVGYLKVKRYFHDGFHSKSTALPPDAEAVSLDGVRFSEGKLLLKSLRGFVLVVTRDGTIFYASPTIQDFLGFHQSDVVQQSVLDLVHIDDRELFSCQLQLGIHLSDTQAVPGCKSTSSPHSLLLPEDSFFLERSFCCRLRCLLDNTSGFLALKFSGHLKYLQGKAGADGSPRLALFAIATPLQPPSVMEIRTKTLIFQTKHRMDFAPMAIDTRGKLVLGFSETELITTGSGYQFIHAADMMYCADNHLRMIKTGDSGFTFFRLLTKTGRWLWVQANARVVFKDGRPDFIIARQKPLTNEEGEDHFQRRRQQLPFNVSTGEGVLYDLDTFSIPAPPSPQDLPTDKPLDPSSILGSLHHQDQSLHSQPQHCAPLLPIFSHVNDREPDQSQQTLERAFLDSHALLSVPGQLCQEERPAVGDFTSQAMLNSLEQILGDIGDGFLEGLEVEQSELRDWESNILRMNHDREFNHILANDVFSYVEEALRRESGGETSGERPQLPASTTLDSPQQTSTHLDSGQEVLSHPNTHLGRIWPASGATHHAVPAHSCHLETPTLTHQTWLPLGASSTFTHTGSHAHPPQRTGSHPHPSQHTGSHSHPSQQMGSHPHCTQRTGSHPHPSASWPQSHNDSVTPQLSSSCVFDPHLPQVGSNSASTHPHAAGEAWNATAAETQIDSSALNHVSGEIPGRPFGNGSLQSTFFCWNGQAQIPKVPLNPYIFPGHPAGSVNFSQNP
ncbi:aryl hydrocarbon receptor-like isoform X2 [Dunckerocampus dactyliophorus]|uniref:aryl hydrocarbon receptor-like isoform X2 n=1 Tax=Dunckerocampus dactyliophorus TaxID=161453 RepID=UPI0024063354|nr:aryl hydrocarbon receptor-like isoform X2 [Dunckerocampus dactyliophorus]